MQINGTSKKNAVYVYVPFIREITANMLNSLSYVAIRNTYFAAELRIVFISLPVLALRRKDKLSVNSISYCVHRFGSTREVSYVGRIIKRLSGHVNEHHPICLDKRLINNGQTAITIHMIESDHLINKSEALRLVFNAIGRLTKSAKSQFPFTAELIAIRLTNPPQ